MNSFGHIIAEPTTVVFEIIIHRYTICNAAYISQPTSTEAISFSEIQAIHIIQYYPLGTSFPQLSVYIHISSAALLSLTLRKR